MSPKASYKLLIHSAQQIVQIVTNGERFVIGKALSDVAVIKKSDASSGLSIVVSRCGYLLLFTFDSYFNGFFIYKYNRSLLKKIYIFSNTLVNFKYDGFTQ